MSNQYFVNMLIDDCRAHLNCRIEIGVQGSYIRGIVTNIQEGILTISDATIITGEKISSDRLVTVNGFSVGWWCWND